MGYRHLFIQNPASLAVRNGQLTVTQQDKTVTFPLEDLDAVLIEHRQVVLTASALTELSQNRVTVYLCDEKHMPCCTVLPFQQHSRQLGMLNLQTQQTEPNKKRLWQQIVIQKIKNQAACLKMCEKEEAASYLLTLARSVHSGDTGNVEAVAAGCDPISQVSFKGRALYAAVFRVCPYMQRHGQCSPAQGTAAQ